MWSAGIVFYEMLALRVPFEARALHDLVKKIIHSPAPRIPAPYQVGAALFRIFIRLPNNLIPHTRILKAYLN